MSKKKRTTARRGLLLSVLLLFLGPISTTACFLFAAFKRAETGDPSQKARLLAEGISDAMNVGILVAAFALFAVLVFGFLVYREVQQAKRLHKNETATSKIS